MSAAEHKVTLTADERATWELPRPAWALRCRLCREFAGVYPRRSFHPCRWAAPTVEENDGK